MLIKLLIAVLVGWASSAIINYLADTLPISKHGCPSCGTKRSYQEYLFFKACKNCGFISRRVFIVWISCIISLFAAFQYSFLGFSVAVMDSIIIFFYFLVIVIDLEHHLVLHKVTLAGGMIFLIIGILSHRLLPTLFGLIAGAVFFFIIFLLGQAYSAIKAKQTGQPVEDAIGFGDVTLSAVCGSLVGWPTIITVLVYGIALGGISSLLYLVFEKIYRKKDVSQAFIAYGPYISLSTLFFWFFAR